jgi:meiotically up-regulated gene 157 (Mug157) protein
MDRPNKRHVGVFFLLFLLAAIRPQPAGATSSQAVDVYLENVSLSDSYLLQMFRRTLPNTLETTVSLKSDNTTYVITGDIPAMWVRDSCAQVHPYALICAQDSYLQRVVRGVMLRHFKHFNSSYPMSTLINSWKEDYTPWEYKYEPDGIAYLIRLCWTYWKVSGDSSWAYLSGDFNASRAFGRALAQLVENTDRKTGLIMVSHRPSDDSTVYRLNIPVNMFIAATMPMLREMYISLWDNQAGASLCVAIRG